jgi:hypothetical protein
MQGKTSAQARQVDEVDAATAAKWEEQHKKVLHIKFWATHFLFGTKKAIFKKLIWLITASHPRRAGTCSFLAL